MPAPRTTLLILIIAGVTIANVLVLLATRSTSVSPVVVEKLGPVQQRMPAALAGQPPIPVPLSAEPAAPLVMLSEAATKPVGKASSATDLSKQIALLQQQNEYLQEQVQTLQRENSAMLDKLAGLGMKNTIGEMAKEEPPPDFIPTDYVGLGAELLSARELEAQPIPTIAATVEDVEAVILEWLRRHHPRDFGPREGAAFAALGVIPEAIDTLPLRAALLARQLAGWYDDTQETLLVVEAKPGTNPALTHTDPIMALSYGALSQHFQRALFGDKPEALTTDKRLARLALLGGDAAQMRLLYQLKNPSAGSKGELPLDDPDHPMNQVPLPAYLRGLATFPLTSGLQFAQALHSIGGYAQVSASYQRLPTTTAEVLDTERYFADPRPPEMSINWPSTTVAKTQPLWDDTLGVAATLQLLRRYNPDDAANAATHGWQTDRWLAFANATASHRGHVVWQTQWATAADATKFFIAIRECLAQQYRQSPESTGDTFACKTNTRFVRLHQLAMPQPCVIYIDAGDEAFAAALRAQFDPATEPAK